MGGRGRHAVVVLACVVVASGCTDAAPAEEAAAPETAATSTATVEPARTGRVTVALAGDVHFEGNLGRLLARPGATLGPISRTLREADVAMLNLETPLTTRGQRDSKELELPRDRYHFRAPPRAVDVLVDSGVDVVSVANNHAGDYGRDGLADTLAAGRHRGLAMVGAGRGAGRRSPRTSSRSADSRSPSSRRTASSARGRAMCGPRAGRTRHGVCPGTRPRRPARCGRASASEQDQLVVVYLHWGKEYEACPTQSQRLLVRDLADAGADVVAGSHSHVLGGGGWAGDATSTTGSATSPGTTPVSRRLAC